MCGIGSLHNLFLNSKYDQLLSFFMLKLLFQIDYVYKTLCVINVINFSKILLITYKRQYQQLNWRQIFLRQWLENYFSSKVRLLSININPWYMIIPCPEFSFYSEKNALYLFCPLGYSFNERKHKNIYFDSLLS